jgi:hypothetical protein
MGLIKNIRLRFHRYFLQKEYQKRSRDPKSVNWGDAKNIGILFNATELRDRQTVTRYKEQLKNDGKQVKLLGFFDSDQRNPNFTFRHFNRKQLDWALRPRTRDVKTFIDTPFDLFLNVEPLTKLHSEYIAALSRAHLKVGPVTDNTECYDLMIEPADQRNVEAFIKQIESLLKKTQTRHEATQI